MRKHSIVAAFAIVAGLAPIAHAQNIIPTHWSSISRPGGEGILRAGSGWGAGSTPSNVISLVDGVLEPESQQWNTGSYWWDETQTASPFQTLLQLDASYTFNHLVLQADNNDDYLIEYWTGSTWQTAFWAGAVGGYGLTTRDSGTLASFTTDRFRFTALNGDQYYAMSEFQAFGVPEAGTWALMMFGFGAVGYAMRQRSARLTMV